MKKEDWQKKGAGHRRRLRDKFLALGLDGFSDVEVVELLLTLGTPRKDCKEAARSALKTFGSLPAVLEAGKRELCAVEGIGPNNCFALLFIHQVARRYLQTRLANRTYIHCSREVADYLIHAMRELDREVFMTLFLDAGHAIIASETIAEGTISVNTVYPREVIKRALHHNAAALIVAHNHPSGRIQPSRQDIALTEQLYQSCQLMHIQLLDHLIIGGSTAPYSFADHGRMEEIRRTVSGKEMSL